MIREVYGHPLDLIAVHYELIHVFEVSKEYSYKGISIGPDVDTGMYKLTYNAIENNNTNNNGHTESYRNSIFFKEESRTPEDREQETGI